MMAIWDDHGMTKEEYEAFEREYSTYLEETGQNVPPSEADLAEMEATMYQPSPADIDDIRKERISHCYEHLQTMPDSVGVELHDFRAMRDYYDSAAFLAEHGNKTRQEARLVEKFARVADKMSYDYDPYDYCDNVDLDNYMDGDEVDESRVHADQAAVIYRDLMTGKADYIASWMDDSIADLEATVKEKGHVETRAEYEDRVRKESELFASMRFEDILQYRVDHDMVLTDVDKKRINDTICDEYTSIEAGYSQDMDMCDYAVSVADARVDAYANNYEAQREVASFGGNVPAYITNDRYNYPVDEHGRALTADEFVAAVEEERETSTSNYMAYRTKLFDRIYDFHKLTMTPDALPKTVTGGKSSVAVITPSTFGYLGDAFKEYHADRVREFVKAGVVSAASIDWKSVDKSVEDARSRVVFTHSDPVVFDEFNDKPVDAKPKQIGLPVVDFTKSITQQGKSVEKQADVQVVADKQISEHNTQSQYDAQYDQQLDDEYRAGKNRVGVSGFDGNRSQGGRSHPDYDFDEYD